HVARRARAADAGTDREVLRSGRRTVAVEADDIPGQRRDTERRMRSDRCECDDAEQPFAERRPSSTRTQPCATALAHADPPRIPNRPESQSRFVSKKRAVTQSRATRQVAAGRSAPR